MTQFIKKDTAQADAMAADYLSGMTARAIAEKYGIAHDISLINFLCKYSKKKSGTNERQLKKERTKNAKEALNKICLTFESELPDHIAAAKMYDIARTALKNLI